VLAPMIFKMSGIENMTLYDFSFVLENYDVCVVLIRAVADCFSATRIPDGPGVHDGVARLGARDGC
jgi:hypothetical protein